jgi:hypothetical protein
MTDVSEHQFITFRSAGSDRPLAGPVMPMSHSPSKADYIHIMAGPREILAAVALRLSHLKFNSYAHHTRIQH